METKPIVTCHGDQSLFSSLHPSLLKWLPKESTEWRRSYGRPPKTVKLEASFVPYDEDILPTDTDKTLISRPYFHIFWTDCDLDAYKQTVKDEILEWNNALKARNIPDWMIVVVVSDESKVKTKLLPRSSVIDKVKNDFCSKLSDRCIVLTEPLKTDQRSSESWRTFVQRLRELLLQAFNKHLNKYEENMRALRESRNELNWSFVNYFLVQEELAFMYEMIGLYDDAMIQYDELDALFTQFIVTHTSGKPVSWLVGMVKDCQSWAGLSLKKSINWDKRDVIKTNQGSVLDLRNYLFSRQCALLFLLQKPIEVAKRAIEYLHNTVQEIRNLKIKMPPGAVDCWVFLSCLEVLKTSERYSTSSHVETYSLYTASLWDYARKKLHSLGEFCGLMPDPDVIPTSEQLTLVIDLTSGMGITEDADEQIPGEQKPLDRLREALSSKGSFRKIYLELSELAMGTFKHISRFRSARLIGKDLAEFYMRLGEPLKAENFLMDIMKSYHQEGWHHLVDGVRLELAKCQQQQKNPAKFLRTACQIAGSTKLPVNVRNEYLQQALDVSQQSEEETYLQKSSLLFEIEDLHIEPVIVKMDKAVYITLTIVNKGPCDLSCDLISLSLKRLKSSELDQVRKPVKREASDASLKEQVPNINIVKKGISPLINVQANFEGTLDSPVSAGIVCVNSHELLRRSDSSGKGMKRASDVLLDDFTHSISATQTVLKVGENILNLSKEVDTIGRFRPNQLLIKIGRLDFVHTVVTDQSFTVQDEQPQISIVPTSTEFFVGGIEQEAQLTVKLGSVVLNNDMPLHLTTSPGLSVVMVTGDGSITLSEGKDCQVFNVKVFQEVTDKDSVDSVITLSGEFMKQQIQVKLSFTNPFQITHRLHTARKRKFLQIVLSGSSETEFEIGEPQIVATNTNDVDLVLLNKCKQQQVVSCDLNLSFLWEVKCNTKIPSLELKFTAAYQCNHDNVNREITYHCTIPHFQTLYYVNVDVTHKSENKRCTVGYLTDLTIQFRQLDTDDTCDEQLVYEIQADGAMWGLCGKTKGMMQLEEGKQEVRLEAIPLSAGFLLLPSVKMYKCSKDVCQKPDEQDTEDTLEEILEERDASKIVQRHAFNTGEVYYGSIGKQVHVYTECVSDHIEITLDSIGQTIQ